jgi:type III secretory pathway component EscV
MRSLFRTLLGLGLLALIAGPAAAQQGRGFGFGGGGNLATLAANTGVQKELKLDDQQVEKAKDLAEKTREKMRETRDTLQGLEGEERRTKQQEISREMNASSLKALGEFLKPEQITRLKQISYQQRGVSAFNDPEVAKKLNLTDSQKGDIQTILQENIEGARGLFSQDQSPEEREAAMKKITELRKQSLSKAEAKLNDEQQKSWKELLGAPFDYKPDPRPNN